MPAANILIVAVDGLRASALGAYGNTSYATPALDQFAADSFLLDACFSPSPELPAIYRALWRSIHPLRTEQVVARSPDRATSPTEGLQVGEKRRPSVPNGAGSGDPRTTWPSLPRVLAATGYSTTLITDDSAVLELPTAVDFKDVVHLADAATHCAADASETSLARLFAAATSAFASRSGPRLVWVHSRGTYGPWDAPRELQQALLDEGDPPPVEEVEPPDLLLPPSADPDIIFRYATAYAAQVMVLDTCWQGLMEALGDPGAEGRWLVILLGLRGFPLGQRRRIGGIGERLHADALHVPMLMRFPDGTGRMARSHQLASHLDVLPTVLDFILPAGSSQPAGDAIAGLATGEEPAPRYDGRSLLALTEGHAAWRDAIVCASARGDRAILTPAWSLLQSGEPEVTCRESVMGAPCSLYVRPDDRWEANDVADLCPEIVDGLVRALDAMAGKIERGDAIADETLPEELKTPLG